jgi:hypothetical protein
MAERQTFNEFLLWEATARDTIDFKKAYVDMAGDLVAGLLLSQIIYWYLPDKHGKSKLRVEKDGHMWIAKGRTDWYDEIRITAKQFDRAVKILEQKGLLTTALYRFNGAPTKHVRLNKVEFMVTWNDAVGDEPEPDIDQRSETDFTQRGKSISPEGEKPIGPKGENHVDERGRSLTEITAETTPKTTTETTTTHARGENGKRRRPTADEIAAAVANVRLTDEQVQAYEDLCDLAMEPLKARYLALYRDLELVWEWIDHVQESDSVKNPPGLLWDRLIDNAPAPRARPDPAPDDDRSRFTKSKYTDMIEY